MAEETVDPQENDETEPAPADAQPPTVGEEEQTPADEPASAPAEDAQEEQAPASAEGDDESEAPAVPEVAVEVADAGTLKKKVTITVPAALIDAKREEMFGELNTSAQVPGFRIGRAPRRLLVKRFGKEVDRDVRNAVLGESIGAGLEKSGLKVLGEPDLDLDAIELPESGDMTYDMEVEVAPEFALPELKGIEVTKPSDEVTDERIDDAIERLRLSNVRYEPTDDAAAEQDAVEVDATISGEDIEETKSSATLRVAPGQIEGLPLVDLGTVLAGKKAGETATTSVTVPAVHPNEAWQGKEVTVDLAIQEVRRRVLPELNDEYAEQLGYESLAELREGFAGRMKAQVLGEAQRAMREQINEYLLANVDFELPEGVATRHAERMLQRRYIDLLQMGLPREQVDERMTEIQASVNEQSQRDLKLSFILQKVADEREIEVTDEEVNARVAQMAAMYRRRPERLRQELESDGTISQVQVAIREEKVAAGLLADAQITEETGESAEETADKEEPADPGDAESASSPAAGDEKTES